VHVAQVKAGRFRDVTITEPAAQAVAIKSCGTGGCNKMNVFDWLSNMDMPVQDKFPVVEVRFKNGRKDFYRNTDKLSLTIFYRNTDKLSLTTGDAIIVESTTGHHLGHVSLQGELVRLQMQKKKVANDDEIKKIYRVATQKDSEKHEEVKKRDLPTLYRTREIIQQLKLNMKLSDVEYQADNTKATFFYSAEDRVDFRELIKILAGEFKVRVEIWQANLRCVWKCDRLVCARKLAAWAVLVFAVANSVALPGLAILKTWRLVLPGTKTSRLIQANFRVNAGA